MTSTIKADQASKRADAVADAGADMPRRLVVELNRRTAQDLAWLVEQEELNKTTIVNRALQVYKHLIDLQIRGGSILLDDPAKEQQEGMLIF